MRVLLLAAVGCVASVLVVAGLARAALKHPVVDGCGEAPSTAGGDRPGDGGVAAALTSAEQPSDSRPSVPAPEQLLNYRPAPENRYWVNDYALAGALAEWSREVSS